MVKDVKSINAKHNGGKVYIDLVVPDKNENTKLGTSIHMVIAIEIWTKGTT